MSVVAMYGKCDITDNTKKGGYQKHSYGKGKQIKAATYKTTGLMRYTCQVCGYEKTETIPVIAHTHNTPGKLRQKLRYSVRRSRKEPVPSAVKNRHGIMEAN